MDWVDAATAKQMMDAGAIMLDVREEHEFARARVPGAVNMPLSAFSPALGVAQARQCQNGQPLIIMCLSSVRSARACGSLPPGTPAVVLEGGLNAWRAAGLPLTEDAASGGILGRLFGV